jgi:hypothetical protein
MLIVNPDVVWLGAAELRGVKSVAVERVGQRVALAWSDAGPHAAFADVPEQKVTMRVVQELPGAYENSPRPGDSVSVSVHVAPSGAEGQRRRLSATGVVTGVTYQVLQRGGSTRTIELVLVSSDGVADPITATVAGGEA